MNLNMDSIHTDLVRVSMKPPIKAKIPNHCKGCRALHTGGIKDGKNNAWCCQFGKPAAKAETHCINSNARPKDE